jgi:type II secretory pathway component HofQ
VANLANSYREYAAKAQADADAATLENVRERNQRAADAWLQMADRQARTERSRAEREASVGA